MSINNELIQIEIAKNNAIERIEAASKSFESKLDAQKDLIDETKVHLTEHVIEKSVSPLNRAITFLGVIFALLTLAGGVFTYTVTSSLETSMETYIKSKVESWLSLDSENSLASRTLDGYRTRALLDAYMIKLARMSFSNGGGFRLLNFKEADKKRLLDIILSPNSSDADFHDAVTLLSVARGEWGFGRENDQVAIEIRKIFSSENIANSRKLRILEIMRNDRGLLPVAEKIISNSSSPSHFRHQAFLMLKDYDSRNIYSRLAKGYALEVLSGDNEPYIKRDAVGYLARVNPLSSTIVQYINKISGFGREESLVSKAQLISALADSLPNQESFFIEPSKSKNSGDLAKLENLIANLLVDLIESNAYLNVTEFRDAKYLSLAYKNLSGSTHSIYVENLDDILENKSLIGKVFDFSINRGIEFEGLVSFFYASYKGEPVVTFGLEFSNEHPLFLKKGKKKFDTGVGWIKGGANNSRELHWHDPYGKLESYNIKSIVLPNKMVPRIRYNKNYIAYSPPFERLIF